MSISKITTANTGKEGLLKINEVIDKSITGVTYQNGLLGIRTQDGTQYTATLPQMPNIVISGGQVTVDPLNFLKYDVTAVVYNCAGNSYSVSAPPALIITLNPGDPTDPRIDFIVGNTSNSLEVIEGTPGTPTVEPFLPADKTLIGKITVSAGATSTGGTTNDPIDLSAYLPLAGGTMTGSIDMQTSNVVTFGATRNIGWQDGPLFLDGLQISNFTDGTSQAARLFLGDLGAIGANLSAKNVGLSAGLEDGAGNLILRSAGDLTWTNPLTPSLNLVVNAEEFSVKTKSTTQSGFIWNDFVSNETDGIYMLSNMNDNDQTAYIGINTGTFPLTPVAVNTPPSSSVVLYSKRNMNILVDDGETLNIEAGAVSTTCDFIQNNANSSIINNVAEFTQNVYNGILLKKESPFIATQNGQSATESFIMFNQDNTVANTLALGDGAHTLTIKGHNRVTNTGGDIVDTNTFTLTAHVFVNSATSYITGFTTTAVIINHLGTMTGVTLTPSWPNLEIEFTGLTAKTMANVCDFCAIVEDITY